MDIFKELARHEDVLYIIISIAAILVFLCVIFIISKIRYPEDERYSSYMSYGMGKKTSSISSGRKEYSTPRKSSMAQGNEKGDGVTIREPQPDLGLKTNCPNSERNDEFPDNSYKDYIEKEIKKGIYIHKLANDDGTERTEISFSPINDKSAPTPLPLKYEYLETANNGQFRKLLPSDEKCFFRTWEENGIRKFEFHGNVEKALANINAIFDDVCEIVEGKQNGATQIVNDKPGTLDSNLKVETPAKIKLA